MKCLKLLIILILFGLHAHSQAKRNNHWYFGQRAGLDFNFTPPLPTNHSPMDQEEGSASISDVNGNLLCYTDGLRVWNRNHQVMVNGVGLAGGYSASQSALIVPKPLDNNILYVFTVPNQSTTLAMTYSIIDMSLDNGLGAVTTKNEILFYDVDEKLTGTIHSNGIDYWIVAKKSSSDVFLSYALSAAGLNTTPVISHAGSVFTYFNDKQGYVVISPDRSKIAVTYKGSDMTQLLDFNNSNGSVSNAKNIPGGDPYGVVFSGDNSKLYISYYPSAQGSKVIQYDLLAGSILDIQNSAYTVIHPQVHLGFLEVICGMALAPDGNIYISFYHRPYMGIVNDPNLPGASCNYVHNGIWLAVNSRNNLGVPNQIYYPATVPCPSPSNISLEVSVCTGESYQLPSGTTVNSAGIYADTIKNQSGNCDSIIYSINLSVYAHTASTITDSLYPGQTYTLPSGIVVNAAGNYTDVLQNQQGCDSTITINLKQVQLAECLVLNNAFTPNGDGKNDNWTLYRYRCFKKLAVKVFNRYGSLVYQSGDYNNTWDGKYLNKHMPDGTYYYVLKVITFNDRYMDIKGNVSILR